MTRVADLGCGEGTLTGDLLSDSGFTQVIAADVSARRSRRPRGGCGWTGCRTRGGSG